MNGRELLLMEDDYGKIALHMASWNENTSTDMISKMIKIGGRELLLMIDQNGYTCMLK